MGRDGLYAEAKIGLEALMQRRAAEFERWGKDVMLVGCSNRLGARRRSDGRPRPSL